MILGISDLHHDTAAVLLGQEGLITAIEEGKLNRVHPGAGLPQAAIEHCLRQSGAQLNDLSGVAMAFDPAILAQKQKVRGVLACARPPQYFVQPFRGAAGL